MRLIDADLVVEKINAKCNSGQWAEEVVYGMAKALYLVKSAQTIERPHGEWVINPNGLRIGKVTHYAVVCSLCKWSTLFADNFCPNCGASMVKEGE